MPHKNKDTLEECWRTILTERIVTSLIICGMARKILRCYNIWKFSPLSGVSFLPRTLPGHYRKYFYSTIDIAKSRLSTKRIHHEALCYFWRFESTGKDVALIILNSGWSKSRVFVENTSGDWTADFSVNLSLQILQLKMQWALWPCVVHCIMCAS